MFGKGESPGTKSNCCCCVSGILFTFLGIGLLFTGLSMVTNYTDFDLRTLPLGWQNSEGQRNLGIVMICLAVVFLAVGILGSVLFFTFANKDPSDQDDVELPKEDKMKSEPSPPIVTVVPPVDHFPDLQPNKSHKTRGKHKRSHGSKSARGKSKHRRKPLATHHEIAEEPEVWNLRELDPESGRYLRAPRSRVDMVANWDVNDGESLGRTESCSDFNDDATDTERDTNSTHLPPILIAPARESFSTCESSTEDLVPTKPDILRVGEDSISSEEMPSVDSLPGTQDTVRRRPFEDTFRFRQLDETQRHKQKVSDDTLRSKRAVELFRARSFEDTLRQASLDDSYEFRPSEETFGYKHSDKTFRQRSFDDTLGYRQHVTLNSKPQDDTFRNTSAGDTFRNTSAGDTFRNTSAGDTLRNTSPGDTFGNTSPGDTFRKHKRTRSSEEVLQLDRELSMILK